MLQNDSEITGQRETDTVSNFAKLHSALASPTHPNDNGALDTSGSRQSTVSRVFAHGVTIKEEHDRVGGVGGAEFAIGRYFPTYDKLITRDRRLKVVPRGRDSRQRESNSKRDS